MGVPSSPTTTCGCATRTDGGDDMATESTPTKNSELRRIELGRSLAQGAGVHRHIERPAARNDDLPSGSEPDGLTSPRSGHADGEESLSTRNRERLFDLAVLREKHVH